MSLTEKSNQLFLPGECNRTQNLRFGPPYLLCKLCSGNKFSTAKWPMTSALGVSDTSFCHGGHFFPSDMIIGRWL